MITVHIDNNRSVAGTLSTWKLSNIGQWFFNHYKKRQADSGIQAVAKQMKKQGFPIEIALAVLANKY